MPARTRTFAAIGLLAAVTLAYTWQAFRPGRVIMPLDNLLCYSPWAEAGGCRTLYNPTISDKIRAGYPLIHFVADSVRTGTLPLWDPHLFAGHPTIANPEAQTFYPGTLLYYLGGDDAEAGDASIVIHVLIAALGSYALLRELKAGYAAGVLAGITYGCNMLITAALVWNPHLDTMVWWPLVMAGLERAMRTRQPRWIAAGGIPVALLLLGGHLERALALSLIIGLYVIARGALLGARRTGRARWAPLGAGVAVLALGAALAAVQLAPALELISLGHRRVLTAAETAAALHKYQPITFLVPKLLGDPTAGNYWWPDSGFNDTTYYFGLIPLILGLLLPALRRDGIAWFFFGTLLLGFALPWIMVPLNMLVQLPGLGQIWPFRLPLVSVAAGSVAGALALDALLRGARPRPRWLILPLAGGAVAWVAWMVRAYWDAIVYRGEYMAGQLAWFALFLAVAVTLVVARLRPGVLASVAVLATAADLLIAGGTYNKAQTVGNKLYPPVPSLAFLQAEQARAPGRFLSLDPAGLMPANIADVYGLDDLSGFTGMINARTFDALGRSQAPWDWSAPGARRLLDLFGVRHLLARQPLDPPPDTSLRLAYNGEVLIYENLRAFPRAFVVHAQRVATGPEQALDWLLDDAGPDLRRVAIVEAPDTVPGLDAGDDGDTADEAAVVARGIGWVEVAARTARPGLLVLAETWYPGWRATVDGAPATVHRVDYVLRGVAVPAGAHVVRFEFAPASLQAGIVVTGLAALSAVALALWDWLHRRAHKAGRDNEAP